jgi:hypothetical protein
MNELEKIRALYEVKRKYVFSGDFTEDELMYIHENENKFSKFVNKETKIGEPTVLLTKQEYNNIVLDKITLEPEFKYENMVLAKSRLIRYLEIRKSTNCKYIIPIPRNETEFYVFTYDELVVLFYIFLFNVTENSLKGFIKTTNSNNTLMLNIERFNEVSGVYYFPKSKFEFIKLKFLEDYKEVILKNSGIKSYFIKKLGELHGME